ncbi:hypothetical protein HOL21_00515 [Candidatus Woesearchaeota archaeon]|jgi:hypothetical protein|nr:hypothetical protein [Candidatus Woesearchaeota archaeon]MBT5396679.1 hypothetical protein [Candidatus Woesearchaeota archaeon]MBT5924376.1 hypothetical protein [Candidatus Woesearchaeota archaeon]MBT6367534.1 hypothetical protein [Candidatus Woesearchaeota archaeon]MBT7763033.1 hypothetical protein [Candidatus Woesearchaeota archaeon]
MLINLDQQRGDYFANGDVTEILRKFVKKEGPITVVDLREKSEDKGGIIAGIRSGELSQLLDFEYDSNRDIDTMQLVERLDRMDDTELMVLPPDYRIRSKDTRKIVVYNLDSLVNLDSAIVKRTLLGDVIPRGPLSRKRKEKEEWNPEKVLRTAMDNLHERKDTLKEKTFVGYKWKSTDGHAHIVSLYRSIMGAELRTFQNFAAYKLLIPTFRKELRLGKSSWSGYRVPLTSEDKEKKQEKVARYERHLKKRRKEGSPLFHYISQLDVDFKDLIEFDRAEPRSGTVRHVRVPSRSTTDGNKEEGRFYKFKLTQVPVFERGNSGASGYVWEVRGTCPCPDIEYRSDRRGKPYLGQNEEVYCAHEIAALHSLRKKLENKEFNVPLLPFVIPTQEMMEFTDKLRYQTILVERHDPNTVRASKRVLNHTEIERLLWAKVMRAGYEQCFTTDIGVFKERKINPQDYLVRFT